jgi:hypothetical protein
LSGLRGAAKGQSFSNAQLAREAMAMAEISYLVQSQLNAIG